MTQDTPRPAPLSLLVEILDWLMAPLIVLWPVSVVVTFWVANIIANTPYDRALSDAVGALSQHVRFDARGARTELPAAIGSLLRADELDAVSFQIRGTRGEVLAGDRDLGEIFPDEGTLPLVVYFRDDTWHDEPVRIAYMFIYGPGNEPHRRVLVQVGETLNKRQKLANEIISGIIIPQFFLLPFVALLGWFGLTQGTRALNALSARLRSRTPADLSPIDLRDVPEEVAPLVDAFNGMLARLKQNIRSQERFIDDAAHQLRAPLAGLRTQLDLALRQSDPRNVKENLEYLRQSVERTSHLVTQLLALARSQSDVQPRMETLDLNALLPETTRDFVARALDKRLDLGFEDLGRPAWVEGDPMLLRELFSNLLDNAVRYTQGGGRITARVRLGEETVSVEIEDNGPGIEEQDRELVFERFYRVAQNAQTGSGLGLAIVRSIAARHRASVQVRPNPAGAGSLFTVVFARSGAPRPAAVAHAEPA
jgi:two-component system sensor histidine kinase TctE